jgi:hypothetical protein
MRPQTVIQSWWPQPSHISRNRTGSCAYLLNRWFQRHGDRASFPLASEQKDHLIGMYL